MPVSLVQKVAGSGAAVTTFTVNVSAVGSGNGLVVAVNSYYGALFSGSPYSVTDNQGNTYTQRAGVDAGTSSGLYLFNCDNVTNAPTQLTIHASASGHYMNAVVLEYSGLNTSGSYDGSSTAASPSNPFSSGNVTTTAAGLLVGCNARLDTTNDYVPDSPWAGEQFTAGNTVSGLYVADRTTSGSGTYSYTGSASAANSERVLLAAFKAAAGGGATPQIWPYLDVGLCGGMCPMGMGGL